MSQENSKTQYKKKKKLKIILENQINVNWKNRIHKISRLKKIQNKIKTFENYKLQKLLSFVVLRKRQNIFISLINLKGEVILKTTLKRETKGKYDKRWQRRKPDALIYCLNSFFKRIYKLNVRRLLAVFTGTDKLGLNSKIKWLIKQRFKILITKDFQPNGWNTMRKKKIKRI